MDFGDIGRFLDGTAISSLQQRGLVEFLVAVIVSMALGGGYSLLYRYYFRGNQPADASLYRSFVLIAPAVTAIFWMIQFSLPLSLGLLGALSFVRFRTPIKRAEDIAFILLTIATGLSCAVYQFPLAGALLILIYGYTLLKRSLGTRILRASRQVSLVISASPDHSGDGSLLAEIQGTITTASGTSPEITSTSSYEGEFIVYANFPIRREGAQEAVLRSLNALDNVSKVDMYYQD
ncbi:MAG: hypothetical protein CL878_11135 [Dehalococcoidia bacterium]|nr:hypothetical protein [Dehalococcoidia bacterium]